MLERVRESNRAGRPRFATLKEVAQWEGEGLLSSGGGREGGLRK